MSHIGKGNPGRGKYISIGRRLKACTQEVNVSNVKGMKGTERDDGDGIRHWHQMTVVPEAWGCALHIAHISAWHGPQHRQRPVVTAACWSPIGCMQGPLILPKAGLQNALSLPLGGSMRPWRSHVVVSRCNVQA